nr:tropomyosin-1, isoforms 33/34-like [Aegilops tauschii subsp. strangulata]
MGHSWYCRRLFQLEEYANGKVRRIGRAAQSGKVVKGPLFGLPPGVVPLSNNSRQAEILAMMPPFNAHGLDPAWVEHPTREVEEFFTNLAEELDHEEPWLNQDTTQEELDYIAARAMEAELARLVGEAGGMENEAAAAAEEEEELAAWVKAVKEVAGATTGPSPATGAGEGPSEEEAEAGEPPATQKRRVLRRVGSGAPVQPGKVVTRQGAPGEAARVTRVAAAKTEAAAAKKKTAVAKKKVPASSSSERFRTPSPPPRPASAGTDVGFDFLSLSPRGKRKAAEEEEEDKETETLAQRAAKRARASTSSPPPMGTSKAPLVVESSPDSSPRRSPRLSPQREERRQEEPPRASPTTPPPSTTPPRGASPARMPDIEPMRTEEVDMGAGGSIPATDVGGEGTTSSQPGTGASPPVEQGDTDTIIEEAAADTMAKAEKVATEEAAETAAKDAAEGFAGETGEGAAKEGGKASAEEEVVDDQPSSSAASGSGKYLKVSDDVFVHLPGMASVRVPAEGEAFDDEVLAAAGLEVVDEPSAGGGTQEERLLQVMHASYNKLHALHRARLDKAKSKEAVAHKVEADFVERVAKAQAWFRQAHEELKAAQGQLAQRDLELLLKQADLEKARDEVREEASKAEAIRSQREAELNSQEEDLAKREADIDAKIHAKDEEVEKLVA